MAKKFGKILAVGAFLGAAILGGIAYYKKSKDDSNSLDDDVDDFQDEFEDEEEDDFQDDFSSVDRGYVTIPTDHSEHEPGMNHKDPHSTPQQTSSDDTASHDIENEEEDLLDDPEPNQEDEISEKD